MELILEKIPMYIINNSEPPPRGICPVMANIVIYEDKEDLQFVDMFGDVQIDYSYQAQSIPIQVQRWLVEKDKDSFCINCDSGGDI